mmetsp:Transcript_23469/g.20843  ORF Transcript_23469/g.20843 Transcript_23469/m.20843 type:complete len:171 (-) Transcript_23469:194-706(-)
MEIFLDLKNSHLARLYAFSLLSRRFIFILFIIFLKDHYLYYILLPFQVVYCILITYMRPFTDPEVNLIETLNELFLALFILLFTILHKEHQWNENLTRILLYLLTLNFVLIFLITQTVFVINIIQVIKSKLRKNKINKDKGNEDEGTGNKGIESRKSDDKVSKDKETDDK